MPHEQGNCDVCGKFKDLSRKEIPGGRSRHVCQGCRAGIDQEIEGGEYAQDD